MSILKDVFSKGNRSLKPHQPGMAKTGEVQQGFVGHTHWRARLIPVQRSLFISAVWAVEQLHLPGLSYLELFSKEWVRLCVAGEWEYSSVRRSRPRTVTSGSPVALPLYGIHNPISANGFDCMTQFCGEQLEFNNVTISAISYLFENPRPYYNITAFPIKCFGQRKVKTFPCLCVGSLT